MDVRLVRNPCKGGRGDALKAVVSGGGSTYSVAAGEAAAALGLIPIGGIGTVGDAAAQKSGC